MSFDYDYADRSERGVEGAGSPVDVGADAGPRLPGGYHHGLLQQPARLGLGSWSHGGTPRCPAWVSATKPRRGSDDESLWADGDLGVGEPDRAGDIVGFENNLY
jgi:hypothetical protein